MKRIGIKDVAKEAGVATSTVSYVLNQKTTETISEETKKRVLDAVKKLGYVPNLNARSLSSKKSNLIGVLIPQTEPGKEFMFSNPFYGELLSSIEYTARKNGYHLILSGTEEDQDYLHVAQNRGVDGIIIVGTFPGSNLNDLKSMNVPIVLVDSYVKDESFHTIGIEDREGAKIATEYLIQKGHREIAFISGSIRENGVNIKRYQGYCEAMCNAGLLVDEKAIYTGTVDYEYGFEAAHDFISRGKKQTAAFITADVISMGVIKGLMSEGLSVPEDLSIVSFDDVYLARMSYPSMTTIHQDIDKKGELAVQLILDAAKASEHHHTERILPLKLVVRDSVLERKE